MLISESLEYAFPNDEEEQERLDMQHAMHTLLMENKLFWAPIDPKPQRILDLGTGTGKPTLSNYHYVPPQLIFRQESGPLMLQTCFRPRR